MGQRYGMLPSEILTRASTVDLVIMDIALTYERHVNESQQEGYVPDVPVDTLLKIRDQTK